MLYKQKPKSSKISIYPSKKDIIVDTREKQPAAPEIILSVARRAEFKKWTLFSSGQIYIPKTDEEFSLEPRERHYKVFFILILSID